MPLTTTIQTLTEFRNTCAEALGFADYAALDTLSAAHVDKALGFAMDHLAFEGGWKWLEREGSFTTTAGYSTGTVSVTNLSTTVTGSGTAWNTSSNVLADDKFNAGEDGFYRIASVTDDTNLELPAGFAGTTASGQSYNIYRDEYDLADGVLELLHIRGTDPARSLTIVSPQQWAEVTSGDFDSGEPEWAMLIGSDATEAGNTGTNQRLQVWPLPDATYNYTYTYRTLAAIPSSGSTNLAPAPQLSTLLFYKAMQEIYRQRQEPERSEEYNAAYVELLVKAKRSEMNRSRATRFVSAPQWGRRGRLWPTSWPDVTSQ